jgi:predicted Zn-dependent protease
MSIDKKKLLDWIESEITESNETAMKWVAYNIMKGKFDDNCPQEEIDKLNSWIKNGEAKERHYDELRQMFNAMEQRAIAAEKERDELQKRVEEYKDAVESLYQIIQRGDLTTLDLKQADDVLDQIREHPNEQN